MTPVFKKKDQSDVENYRPVSILPIDSKVYKSCMYDQMYENKFSQNNNVDFAKVLVHNIVFLQWLKNDENI